MSIIPGDIWKYFINQDLGFSGYHIKFYLPISVQYFFRGEVPLLMEKGWRMWDPAQVPILHTPGAKQ